MKEAKRDIVFNLYWSFGPLTMLAILGLTGWFGPKVWEKSEENRRKVLAQTIANAIGDPNIPVLMIENTVVLEGTVASQKEKIRAEKIALIHMRGLYLRNLIQAPRVENLLTVRELEPTRKAAANDSLVLQF